MSTDAAAVPADAPTPVEVGQDRRPARGPRPGQVVALGAGLAQVGAGFLAWTASGAAGLDVVGPTGPRIGVALVALAAVPLLGLLTNDRGWPRVLSGTLTALLVLGHLVDGPDGALASGVVTATWAAIAMWLAGALATGPLDEGTVPRVRVRR